MRCQYCKKEILYNKDHCPYCGGTLFGGKNGRTDFTWLIKSSHFGLVHG